MSFPRVSRTAALGCLLSFLASVGCAAEPPVAVSPDSRIVVSPDAPAPVHRAVEDLRRDFAAVLGAEPPVVGSLAEAGDEPALVVAGPDWSEPALPLDGGVTGREAHAVYVARTGEGRPHVVLHGSDLRGALYAIYTFSEKALGIPPLWFWASWEPERRERIELPADFAVRFDPPDVRWRAWFPNDQRQITPWRHRNPGEFDRVAETMLRLKLNMIDVLSILDAGFSDEYDLRYDAELARRFGLAVTSTHTAPLGAHPSESRWSNYWTRIRGVDTPPERSIHDPQSLVDYWTYHVEAAVHHDLEMVWPVAFRGAGDVAFWERGNFEDPGTDEERGRVIREMLDRQISLLKATTGMDNPPMRITLYNEKSDFTARGLLELPEEPGLIYNFVAARRDHYPPPDLLRFEATDDQLVGYYFNYQFTSTGSHIVQAEGPHKMEANFRTVDAQSRTGVELSVVNAGNIREHVMELAANAEMMWDFDAYDSTRFLKNFAARYFGEAFAEEIAAFTLDFYEAYWEQHPPALDVFERQYLFQDLRLHRAMRLLTPELEKDEPDRNPFWGGDWFRIDVASHGSDSEVEAVAIGMRESVEKLRSLTRRADELLERLPPERRTFFNDNFRVQARFLLHASETVRCLAEAVLARRRGDEAECRDWIRQAAEAAEAMETGLLEAEHGIFDRWYEPTRSPDTSSIFRIRERREAIEALLD